MRAVWCDPKIFRLELYAYIALFSLFERYVPRAGVLEAANENHERSDCHSSGLKGANASVLSLRVLRFWGAHCTAGRHVCCRSVPSQ